jgi:hypothetical protein
MILDRGDGRPDGDGAYEKPGFGPAPGAGAVHVVAGSSGQTSGGALNHPVMHVSLNTLGSLVLDVRRGRLDAAFLDAAGAVRDRFTILKETNRPPVAGAGADAAVECTSPAGARVVLDGSASADPDSAPGTADDIVLYEWIEAFGHPGERLLGTGAVLDVELPAGSHAITLRVTDRAGASGTDEVLVTVADTTPPAIEVTVEPALLWPANHRLVPIRAEVAAADVCGPVSVVLASIASDEADDAPGGGDGRTAGDVGDAGVGTEDYAFRLRAERSGASGDGRTYTIVYTATDAAGLTATAAAAVRVPRDWSGLPVTPPGR